MPTKSWRDDLKIHPAAGRFPMMSRDELRKLGEDVIKNGLTSPVVLWSDGKSPAVLLDGRNRLDAIEIATGSPAEIGAPSVMAGKDFLACNRVTIIGPPVDPYTFVVSANIFRRHLNDKERAEILFEVIARAPEKSDRQIAKEIGVDHKTIGRARAKGEDVGRIPHVETRADSKGRQQPARKAPIRPIPPAAPSNKSKSETDSDSRKPRDGIGPASTGEVERLQARVEELENENYRLKRSNIALRDQIGGGKPGLPEKLEPLLETLFEQNTRNMTTVSLMAVAVAAGKLERLLVDHGIMPASRRTEDPQGYARLLKDRAQREARQRDKDRYAPQAEQAAEAKPNSDSPPPPPADDDIPGFLLRAAP
jgi:hypothetical protein